MNVGALLRACGRRWYLTVAGIAATIALCTLAVQQVPPTYEATGDALLLPPSNLFEEGANPYLALSGMGPALDVLVKFLDAETAREQIGEVARTAEYTIGPDVTTSGPILVVTATDTTPAGALAAMHAVLESIPPALDELQASVKVPAGAEISSMTLAADTEPIKLTRSLIRAVVVAAGAGLLGTAYMVALIDALLRRRSANQGGPSEPAPGVPDPPDSEVERGSRAASHKRLDDRAGGAGPIGESGPDLRRKIHT